MIKDTTLPAESQRFACGMSHLFDDVPMKIYPTLRKQIYQVFGSPRLYHYCRSGEKLITPQQQKALKALFEHYGLTLPEFDLYVDA